MLDLALDADCEKEDLGSKDRAIQNAEEERVDFVLAFPVFFLETLLFLGVERGGKVGVELVLNLSLPSLLYFLLLEGKLFGLSLQHRAFGGLEQVFLGVLRPLELFRAGEVAVLGLDVETALVLWVFILGGHGDVEGADNRFPELGLLGRVLGEDGPLQALPLLRLDAPGGVGDVV